MEDENLEEIENEEILDENQNLEAGNEDLEHEEFEEGDLNAETPEQKLKDEGYGAKVRKRINKEVSKNKALMSENSIYRNDLDNARRELAEYKSEKLKEDKERLNSDIESFKKQAADALEEGNTEGYVEINNKMTDAKVDLSRANAEEIVVPEKTMAPSATHWMERNKEWIDDDPAKFKRAQRISDKLVADEGYSVDDDSLYDEIDSRLNKKREVPPATVHVPGSKVPKKPNPKTTLTKEDMGLMKKFELDPNNAEHRKAWLEGKGA